MEGRIIEVLLYLFIKKLIEYLKQKFTLVKKIYYISDGAASQYKNRKKFIISVEWHFSATSHGKGACDGVGGTVKRLAARASLQRPTEQQIMTPYQLYEWAQANIPACVFHYCSQDDYNRTDIFLKDRFDRSRTIYLAHKLHSFVPLSENTVRTRMFSFSSISTEERVSVDRNCLKRNGG